MKKLNKLVSIFCLSIFVLSLGISTYADVNLVPGFKQVTSVGGENDTNTNGIKDGVTVSKTIEETEIENYFDITLKVKTTTSVQEIIRAQDVAIVLVMDISNTMNNKVEGTARIRAAKDSVKDFIDNFYTFANQEGAENAVRKIGLVTFNSHSNQIFGLSECKTETKKEELKSLVESVTAPSDFDQKFTNMEAGLSHARDILNGTNIKNKYIIFLTDGLPTTYVSNYDEDSNRYIGYGVNTAGEHKTVATPGYFYNYEKSKIISSGTNYSDYGARMAENVANSIKSNGVKIYSIGVGISSQHTLFHLLYEGYPGTVDTDTEANNHAYYGDRYYAVLPGVNVPSTNALSDSTVKNLYDDRQYYKNWLQNYIGSGTGYYYDSTNKTDILAAYKSIFDGITEMTESSALATWVAEDPMGTSGTIDNIEFVGLYDDNNELHDSLDNTIENQSDTANFSNNKISWDLKKSEYVTNVVDNTTYYTYEVKYRVRLENELSSFDENGNYQTNGLTRLTYVTRVDGVISNDKYIDFPIPSVKGYLGSLIFTKESSFDNSKIEGVKFKLSHDENCECHKQRKYPTINSFEAISNENGEVVFTNIPSGHKYKLEEISTINDYILSSNIYDVIVSYGTTTSNISNNTITNDIKRGNLEITKVLKGNVNNSKKFEFNLEVYFKGEKLTGEYKYKINNGNEKTLNINEDVIKLGNNDTIVIYDLPVGSTYNISEINKEGYQVQYELNSSGLQNGFKLICNEENKCRIEEGENNVVKFINYAEFILPATGSSKMLIMIIIGTLLLVGPVIYIGYSFYKDKNMS